MGKSPHTGSDAGGGRSSLGNRGVKRCHPSLLLRHRGELGQEPASGQVATCMWQRPPGPVAAGSFLYKTKLWCSLPSRQLLVVHLRAQSSGSRGCRAAPATGFAQQHCQPGLVDGKGVAERGLRLCGKKISQQQH